MGYRVLRKPPIYFLFLLIKLEWQWFQGKCTKIFLFLNVILKIPSGESIQNIVRKEQRTLCKQTNYADLDKLIKQYIIMIHSNLLFSSKQSLRKTPEKCAKCQRRSEIWAWLKVTFKPVFFLWCRLINPININEKCVVPICKPWAEIPYCPSKILLYNSNIELLHLKHILTWKFSKFNVYSAIIKLNSNKV